MKIHFVVAETPGNAILKTMDYDPGTLKEDEVLLKNRYSVISAGTERAWLSGSSNNPGQRFPYYPGYSASGEVIAVGSAVTSLKTGDRVLITWSGHRSHTVKKADSVFRIDDDSIDLLDASFAHIASFPMLGVRRLRLELGESVMVAGLGLLGLLAVQIAACSGALPLLVSDYDPARRKLALELGADAAFDPADPDFIGQVRSASGGKGVDAVVEVTGVAAALKQALKYVADEGRISLLGCTRVPDAVIDFYQEVHCPGVTLIGAHTRNRPRFESRPGQWTEHDDYRTFLRLLARGKLRVRPLISGIVSPEQAHEVYNTILGQKNPPPGFVFDWNLLS